MYLHIYICDITTKHISKYLVNFHMCCLEWFVHGLVRMKEVCKGDSFYSNDKNLIKR